MLASGSTREKNRQENSEERPDQCLIDCVGVERPGSSASD